MNKDRNLNHFITKRIVNNAKKIPAVTGRDFFKLRITNYELRLNHLLRFTRHDFISLFRYLFITIFLATWLRPLSKITVYTPLGIGLRSITLFSVPVTSTFVSA